LLLSNQSLNALAIADHAVAGAFLWSHGNHVWLRCFPALMLLLSYSSRVQAAGVSSAGIMAGIG